MGNRAVIVSKDTTKENKNEKLGVYVHWYGSKEDIQNALDIAKDKKIRTFSDDNQYAWARFVQIFANIISEESEDDEAGIGIGIVSQLDCHNYDNGVYYVDDNFDIVKHTDGSELEDE